jgi:5-formaminoimidazole-4-carboxamide-1-beta-D-ribofuranosyl 5'-monophosphate synthetase
MLGGNDNSIELLIYRAACDSLGAPEGRLDKNMSDPRVQKRRKYAMDSINRNFRMNRIHIAGNPALVRSEEEAQKLIQEIEESVEGATSILKLTKCRDGLVGFERRVRFQEHTYADEPGLMKDLLELEEIKKRDIDKFILGMYFNSDFHF